MKVKYFKNYLEKLQLNASPYLFFYIKSLINQLICGVKVQNMYYSLQKYCL